MKSKSLSLRKRRQRVAGMAGRSESVRDNLPPVLEDERLIIRARPALRENWMEIVPRKRRAH